MAWSVPILMIVGDRVLAPAASYSALRRFSNLDFLESSGAMISLPALWPGNQKLAWARHLSALLSFPFMTSFGFNFLKSASAISAAKPSFCAMFRATQP